MSRLLRIGILGTGRMANALAQSLGDSDVATVVAVGSRATDSAQQFANEFGLGKFYASYEALAEDPDVDLVYVSSPHSLHSEHCLMCLEAGKAVLCEKPFSINAKEARVVIERARQKKLFLMEAMWTRFIPAIEKLRELLTAGTIGDVNLMTGGGAFIPTFDPDHYLFQPELGGGVLLDAGVYLVSIASMVFGPPEEILATGTISDRGIDEHDAFLLRHDGGAIASLYVSLKTNAAPTINILGERGHILVHAPLFAPTRLTVGVDGMEDEIVELPFAGNGYQFQVGEAARCIGDGRLESSVMRLDETLQIMEAMDEIRRQVGLRYPMET